MDKRNKKRRNRGRFQNTTSDNTLKDEGVNENDFTEQPSVPANDAQPPLIATSSNDTCKATDVVLAPDSVTVIKNNEKFSKRKIVSNWNRYEEEAVATDENEEVFQRGADFNDLVDGGATAYFRFKDELEWEDESMQSTGAEFLSLNCKDLASALLCVPLPARLLIDEELFPKKILKKLEAAAKSQEKLYSKEKSLSPAVSNEVVNRTTQLLLDTCTNKIFVEHLEEETCSTMDNDTATFTWATCEETNERSECQPSLEVKDIPVEAVDTTVLKEIVSDPKNQQDSSSIDLTVQKKEAVDDDLEFLLSLSTPQSATSGIPETEKQHGADDLKPQLGLKSTTKPEVKLFEVPSPQNLEDWLDSILEE